jgi:hypothetical protein
VEAQAFADGFTKPVACDSKTFCLVGRRSLVVKVDNQSDNHCAEKVLLRACL